MNVSATFIRRAVATTLLSIGVALAGVMAFRLLPVSPLPQVDFPTISVQASLPGASPEVMASTVATPLERALGRIAGVTEMTSGSSLGSTHITLQFDLNRDIDGAARDVQAAINAARSLLPSGMPANPTYRKVNPADAPIMILALTSRTLTRGQMYDSASTVLAQKIAQLKGVGQVTVGGSALPAVRVALNPTALNHYGISLEQVRTALASANANRPKGSIEFGDRHWQILASDQALHAADYPSLLVAYRNGRPVRLSDIATVSDSVENVRNAGMSSGQPAVLLIVFRQPGANIIDTVDGIRAAMPRLRAEMPAAIDIDIANDRTPTIRASLRDVERTLMISIALVVMVVFLFLRHGRATLIPSAAVPVSLLGTFCVMYLAGFSLNNLSLMALTVATGFVVDDAVVVLENITRHIEGGMKPMAAALQGAREVGFTVISMSLSLVAVFIPILMMGGIIGRLFREFAVTLSAAILVSLVVSLTLTPMMCSRLLKGGEGVQEGRFQRWSESLFTSLHAGYRRSLDWALRHSVFMTVVLMATIALNIFLYVIVPKGFFPQQDTGRLMGSIQADQGISFQAMQLKLKDFMGLVAHDRDVASVVGFTGGGQTNSGNMFIALRPLSERSDSADAVIARLRARTAREPGARLFLQTVQDIRMGGRPSQAQYQYTLQSDDLGSLNEWAPRLTEALQKSSVLLDVNSDQQEGGQQTRLTYDRDMLAQLGLTVGQVDATLNDAFGQRQVSTIYMPLNQYHVVMELAPAHTQRAESLNDIYLAGKNGTAVPLAAVARAAPAFAPLSVNHQGQFVATTLSFNLPPGKSLTEAGRLIDETAARIGMPANVHGGFQGNAKAFQESLATMPLLILAALLTMYIVLGVLYESYVHPVTILSTLPSAGVGALLALMAFHTEFSIIALIGVLLLVGIVKKNAIMMIDVALDAQRHQGLAAKEAIRHACLLRFRPIMMTTMAALFGAVPLALGHGDGAELRQPLGIAVVGGLLVSQLLTLYTTPIVFVGLDNFRRWCLRRMGKPDHAGVVGAGL